MHKCTLCTRKSRVANKKINCRSSDKWSFSSIRSNQNWRRIQNTINSADINFLLRALNGSKIEHRQTDIFTCDESVNKCTVVFVFIYATHHCTCRNEGLSQWCSPTFLVTWNPCNFSQITRVHSLIFLVLTKRPVENPWRGECTHLAKGIFNLRSIRRE
jgi:hypothetical protein